MSAPIWPRKLPDRARCAGVLPRLPISVARDRHDPRDSVVKAVYIDRREHKCACVGGASTVPLGFLWLTENLAMAIGITLASVH